MIKSPEELIRKLGLSFDNPGMLKTALTHRSAGSDNNERLEFLGDSVLGFVIAKKLYEIFPGASEGVLSRLRASLVNQDSLAELARYYDLGNYLRLGSGELKSGGYRRDSILSDALEAVMGALLMDQGFSVCQNWILSIFSGKLDELSLDTWKKDPKTALQEFMQAKKLDLPIYNLVTMIGQPHAQIFKINCKISLIDENCTGTGSSRKKAEQDAAEKMLSKLSRLEKTLG